MPSRLDRLCFRAHFPGGLPALFMKFAPLEAPQAYKAIEHVIGNLAQHGLAAVVATFRPRITFNTAGGVALVSDPRTPRADRRQRDLERQTRGRGEDQR